MTNPNNPSWNFKPIAGSPAPGTPSQRSARFSVPNHHVRHIYITGIKAVTRMEVQAALTKRAVQYNLELYQFTLTMMDEAFGRIFDLFYAKARSQPHEEQIKRFIEVTIVDLMQSISTELTDTYGQIAAIAAEALESEDVPGFFDRLFGRI
ncbi:MAG: hypothetical protein EXR62_07685 [Chloroflexi bacterium]|nr:hypothetical protein [Chloroflexota bacterium]